MDPSVQRMFAVLCVHIVSSKYLNIKTIFKCNRPLKIITTVVSYSVRQKQLGILQNRIRS